MAMSSFGYVLAKKWSADVDVFSLTAWQLIAGGIVLAPIAVAVEGAPPTLDGHAVAGFGYVSVVATAVAFAAWFTGLRHLPTGTVGLIGLLNPVTGVLLGTLVAGETLAPQQLCGLVLVFAGVLLGQPAAARVLASRRADTNSPERVADVGRGYRFDGDGGAGDGGTGDGGTGDDDDGKRGTVGSSRGTRMG
jgi:probable blue pigment (indigoidine) exporter